MNLGNYRHGHSRRGWASPTYRSWTCLRVRCDTGKKGYEGISYDPRWANFMEFLADMGERPPGTTIDRIDNDGWYIKENCRWVTPLQQTRNRRKTIYAEFRGAMIPLSDIAAFYNVSYSAILHRFRRGRALDGSENRKPTGRPKKNAVRSISRVVT